MARVVQRRSSPPYLLIVFVMLFVAATALAVIFYNQYSNEAEQRKTAVAAHDDMKQKLSDRDSKVIPELVDKMTAQPVTADVALKSADEALALTYAQPHASSGLVETVKGMNDATAKLQEKIDALTQQAKTHQAQVVKRDDTIRTLTAQFRAKQQADAAALKAAQAQVASAVAAKQKQLDDAVKEKDAIIADRDKQIQLQAQHLEDQKREVSKRDGIIAVKIDEIRRLKEPKGKAPGGLAKADGKVAKVLPEQQLCYVTLGRKDGIRRGTPFAVHSARAPINEKTVKAKIIIVSVFDDTSECRIVESSAEDPLIEGDLVANLAYDAARIHKFVVEGDFDLYGRGRADPLANSRIRRMIQTWGGRVGDTVTVDTDFVIMGAEPVTPPKPAGDAPAQEWELYRQEMKKYQRYRAVRDAAKQFNVRILNTTRFLAFSGYVPKTGIVE